MRNLVESFERMLMVAAMNVNVNLTGMNNNYADTSIWRLKNFYLVGEVVIVSFFIYLPSALLHFFTCHIFIWEARTNL